MSEIIKTLGIFKRSCFRNAYTGYTVFEIEAADVAGLKRQCSKLSQLVKCIGVIPEYKYGTPLYIEGKVSKSSYGYQIDTTLIKEHTWNTASTANYLTNICSGVGVETAMSIAKIFGEKLFKVINREDAPKIISDTISSISFETAVLLCDTIRATTLQREVYGELSKYGVPWASISKLVMKYGIGSIEAIKENPYIVGDECGLDFYTCDRIAKLADKDATDAERLKYALFKAFKIEEGRGNVFTSESDLCQKVKSIIKRSALNEVLPSTVILDLIDKDDDFVVDYDSEGFEAVYSKWLFKAEKNIAQQISRLMDTAVPLNYDDSVIKWAEEKCGITYAPQQRDSFGLIKKTGVAIITGGPGTGKSTTVNGVISAYEKLNPNKIIRLCAPTGRAAQRMTETTGREAVTIHRLLDYKPFGEDVTYKNADNPIEADLIVVDETSMLDVQLASIFLSAIKSGSLVIFIGDINQLPSVGPGDVLHDMIYSDVIPSTQLTTVYRQGSKSPIIVNANRINNGITNFMETNEFRTIVTDSPSLISDFIAYDLSRKYSASDPFETQVLCPTHRGEAGVTALNTKLQALLNPKSADKKEVRYGNKIFREHDKVILLNNNYKYGYFNGDIGVIKEVNDDGLVLNVLDKEIVITKSHLDDVGLAYCMTIHKSQGSEFKDIIIALPKCNMLKRNLFYTAVTRAKKSVTIYAEYKALNISVATNETGCRNSRLMQRIQKAIEKQEI